MAELYYTPPKERLFRELKEKATEIWLEYDNDYGYATSKINRIKDLWNIYGNFMFMVEMFDHKNQRKLAVKLSPETKKAVRDRMIDGGELKHLIIF